MKFFVNLIQKNGDEYTSAVFNFDTIEKAKEKAYHELSYGFSGVIDMCTVYITDEYGNILLKDTYEKPKENTYESPKEEPKAETN